MNTHKEREPLSNCCSAKPCGEIAYDNSGRCGDCKEGCMFVARIQELKNLLPELEAYTRDDYHPVGVVEDRIAQLEKKCVECGWKSPYHNFECPRNICVEPTPPSQIGEEPTRYATVDGRKPYYTNTEVIGAIGMDEQHTSISDLNITAREIQDTYLRIKARNELRREIKEELGIQ